MELIQLYKMQNDLDEYVIESKNLESFNPKTRLTNTILAMMVETGEFANEVRCFKHWTNKPMSDRDIVIEEYVDILHFFLSIGNQLGFTGVEVEKAYQDKWEKNFDRQDNGY